MSAKIQALVNQIHELDDELRDALHEQETRALYEIEGAKVRFERAVHDVHRQLKKNFVRWFFSSEARNVASSPFIYGMAIPMVAYDLALTLYQAVCFRLYGIPRFDRSKYIVIDRHQLQYLNSIEKFNCVYCGYANGLLAYASEITARTEQHWCPIKRARKVLGSHKRYADFLGYGAADSYREGVDEQRAKVRAARGTK